GPDKIGATMPRPTEIPPRCPFQSRCPAAFGRDAAAPNEKSQLGFAFGSPNLLGSWNDKGEDILATTLPPASPCRIVICGTLH
ncbi:MAG: hypothetical protein ACREJ0_05620, partial [Geminicoccaceae bacterium]